MIEQCKLFAMKPVCDHPSYCKNDKAAVYLGQSGHLAYRPHRVNNGYMPAGMTPEVRDKWNGLCSYTANANGNYALCNIPTNTHAWRHPGQTNPGFMCAAGASFAATLQGLNGVPNANYIFTIMSATPANGRYSDRMKSVCKTLKMKPVCDHPNYCKNDASALYIGQTGHIAYKPHRNNNSYMPGGFAGIAGKWDGLCSYTANANGNYALCNIPANTHAWRHPGQYNPGFVCGKENAQFFTGSLGAKNGVSARKYEFRSATLAKASGSYSDGMIATCKNYGMMPICDHPSYCKNDKAALYIGQSSHIAYRPYRNNNGYMPTGFAAIRDQWNNLCSYTAKANKNSALCNIPINTHSWKTPAQANPGFICGKGAYFTATLGGKNNVPGREYSFEISLLAKRTGKYSTRMIEQCRTLGMKPVCDHPNYCRNDVNALYIGQENHLAYRPHRNNNGYMPDGFATIRDKWDNLCSYTANANGNNALCNIPINSHAWKNPAQANNGFVCGKVTTFTADLGTKNGVQANTWVFAKSSLSLKSGSYSNNMVSDCARMNMKPVCDHPTYCKQDTRVNYIGQSGHLAYAPHRNNDGYMPKGLKEIRDNWSGLCSYTGTANGNNALCNIPSTTHSWKNPTQANPGFICSKLGLSSAKVFLGPKNGVAGRTYMIGASKLSSKNGKYSTRMIAECMELGMKPICDHPHYCKNDASALYIGQTSHIAYKPYRSNTSYMPSGFEKVKSMWDGLCSYTANANGNNALCNIPANSHSWKTPAQANPGFMCGKAATFKANIAAKNGARGGMYEFEIVKLESRKGKYSDRMVEQCKKQAMKPVCDHPSYCKNNKASLYLGQSGHLAYRPHRNNVNYSPGGFAEISHEWDTLCSYTANANGNNALCNIPINTHAWRTPAQYNPGFVCGKPASFKAKLGAKNGVKAQNWEFTVASLQARSGKYSTRMVQACKAYGGMQPVCDHPSYCKNDKASVYLGQSGHLAYAPHRNNVSYQPSGFKAIAGQWNNLCSYTLNANGNYALCNIPANTHAWRHPGQYNPGFVCAKPILKACTPHQVANSDKAKKGSITGSEGSKVAVKCSSGFGGGGTVVCNKGKFTNVVCKKITTCKATQQPNSDKKASGSIKGSAGAKVAFKCNSGYTGGGVMLCVGSKQTFALDTGKVCSKIKACPASQVANSNKASKGSIKGNVGAKVSVTCSSGFSGSGTATCQANQKWTVVSCKKNASGCKGDVDGNKKVNIEDLLILLGNYGKTNCNAGNKQCAGADQDGNKKVNIEDLLVLLGMYGKKC